MEPTDRDVLIRTLSEGASAIEQTLTSFQLNQFARYAELLLETNRHTNLTRIIAPADIAIKHFVDSLTVFKACSDLATNAAVADVGTGAGFPGLVLKIARPELKLILIDSLRKRLLFLSEVVETLGLVDVSLIHTRAEDAGRDPLHRGKYDLVTARAVAGLPTLLEWCAPLVRMGGRFVAMKSGAVEAEYAQSLVAAEALGLDLETDCDMLLPLSPAAVIDDAARRRLLVYRKTAQTSYRFPRSPAEVKRNPLG